MSFRGQTRTQSAKSIDLLRCLDCFLQVAETGNMTATARIMQLTQSAVSQQIQTLESIVGASLFDRTLRPLKMTKEGRLLYEHAEKLLGDADNLLGVVQRSGQVALPTLRMAVLGSLSGRLMPEIVMALMERVTIKSVSVWSGLASEHRDALLNRFVDVIISSSALYDIDRLDRFNIFREPFVLLLPADGGDPPESLKDMAARVPLVRYSGRSPIGMQIERHLRRVGVDAPPWVEFDSPDALIATVSKGHGWAISTPLHVIHCRRGTDGLRVVPLPGPALSRNTFVIARSRELGRLPRDIAEISCRILRMSVVPEIVAQMPWLEPELVVGPKLSSDSDG